MESKSNMKTCVFLVFSTLLVQVVWSNGVQNFPCLSCSGVDFTREEALRCLNDTASIKTFIHCNTSWPCSHREQINEKTGKINSVLRGCEPKNSNSKSGCVYSNPNNDCVRFCYSENCNNETNLWPHLDPNCCSCNVASGFVAMAVPVIAFIFLIQ